MGQHSGAMTPQRFVEKWARVELSERSASHQHFIDLCRLLGQPPPADHDATGAEYAFEKGVDVSEGASKGAKGDHGFADVWWKDKFAWEYKRKGKYKDLADAYRQLLQYREALGNPPLLIVSDIARTEIHTNFTGTKKEVHSIALAEMTEPSALDKLRRVFTEPETFRPQITAEKVTQDVAAEIGQLALALQARGHDPHAVAHFLMKCVFCLFAEDIALLPNKLFKKLLDRAHKEPAKFKALATQLFAAMKSGGEFGLDPIPFFNGGLFDDSDALDLNYSDVGLLMMAAGKDWSAVEPHVFGTLFERSLDPSKRAQIGAHYTSRDDIMLVVEPVIMMPLRREWDAVKAEIASLLIKRAAIVQKAGVANLKGHDRTAVNKLNDQIHKLLGDFQGRLAHVRVLDPACGSGNFLYVALQQLLNLEKELIAFGAMPHIAMSLIPRVRPTQLHGIEINAYAAELASVVIWIGYLQWMRDNGFVAPSDPILEKMETIENRDAILDLSDEKNPAPAKWPEADFIIGNPPFLGGNKIRQGLGDGYVEKLFSTYRGELSAFSDLCCYWFELGRRQLALTHPRLGLLATQGIRGGTNREVLEAIKRDGDIFLAYSDRDWILDGAAVHVSIVGFDDGSESQRTLDGVAVATINANLSTAADTTTAVELAENVNLCFYGSQQKAKFDVDLDAARRFLSTPNASNVSNLIVVKPSMNGAQVLRRTHVSWVIDFGLEERVDVAAQFEAPFEYVRSHIFPIRQRRREVRQQRFWWLHARPSPRYRRAIETLPRYIVSPVVSKHRVFIWADSSTLADHASAVMGRPDDYFFGVLHSSIHESWARKMGTQVREAESGFRYTPSTCFETFPLPWPPGKEDVRHPAYVRISAAAKELNEKRERWLNPPEWIEPLAAKIDAADSFADMPPEARGLVRQSAIQSAAAKDPRLKKRTLTNLYNERPTWLKLAHEQLDRAVLAAYAAVDPAGQWDEDWAAVWVDSGAGHPLTAEHPLSKRRGEVDQKVLGNLLRLNHQRATTTA